MPDGPVPLDFGLGSEPGRHGVDAGAMHWNCFVEPLEGKSQAVLRSADGVVDWAPLDSTGTLRGMHVMGDYLFALSGTTLFQVNRDGGSTVVGTVQGQGAVMMTRNDAATLQLVIVTAEGEKYCCESSDSGTTFDVAEISDADLPACVSCTYLNQRVLYGVEDGRVFFSAVDDATDIDPLDVFTAEGNPDGLVAAISHLQEIWCFGKSSLEIFRNTTDETTPFRRNEAGVVPRGCLNKHTIKAIDIDLFWVGDDRKVYRARGYNVETVSSAGVNDFLRQTEADDIEAMTLQLWGHDFYVLSSSTGTWAFNRTTGKWDPRVSFGKARWFATQSAFFNGQTVVGSIDDANLYRIDRDARDEAGTKLVWKARTAPMHAFPSRICVDRLFLDLVTGVGLNSADTHESTPKVGLRWSDDGGATWSRQLLRGLGSIGARQTRVVFDGLGATSPTGRIWEVEMSSPVIRSLMYAAVEGDPIGT